MYFWQRFKLGKMVSRFEKGIISCEQCRTCFPISGLAPLSLAQCGKCGYVTVIPARVADFWLYQPLGGGGIGSVYLAYSPDRDTRCAVKLLQRGVPNYDRALAALESEAETLSRMGDHPYIVKLIGCGFDGEEYYLAMDFVDGERLDLRITRVECVTEREALRILLYLVAAEKHIYQRGYLYADMKPENVIVTKRLIPVLIDFGLCMPLSLAAVSHKNIFVGGSPYYLPPERLQKGAEGPCSEIYSLGMLMFNALTGDTFFKFTGNVKQLAMKHVQTARLSVTSAMLPQCSPAAVEMLGRMLRKEPSERYQTYEELEEAAILCLRKRR